MTQVNSNGNKPILKRRTVSGNISVAVFRNTATNRQTQEQFVTDNVSIQTGYFDEVTQKWVNRSVSFPLADAANLSLALNSLVMSVMAQPAPAPVPAPAPPVEQPVGPDGEVPF